MKTSCPLGELANTPPAFRFQAIADGFPTSVRDMNYMQADEFCSGDYQAAGFFLRDDSVENPAVNHLWTYLSTIKSVVKI